MGSNGLSHAFLFNRLDAAEAEPDTGLLIDNAGRIAPVGKDDWTALLRLVADAKTTVADSGGGTQSWSRSQYVSSLRLPAVRSIAGQSFHRSLALAARSTASGLQMTRPP